MPTAKYLTRPPAAGKFFETVRKEAAAGGVTVHETYTVARNVARSIVETAVARKVNVVVLPSISGRRIWRAVKGNVIHNVARRLPKEIQLVVPGTAKRAAGRS